MAKSTKVMIDVEGGNNILYLPLDKIVRQSETEVPISVQSPSSGRSTSSIRELTDQVLEEIRKRNRR